MRQQTDSLCPEPLKLEGRATWAKFTVSKVSTLGLGLLFRRSSFLDSKDGEHLASSCCILHSHTLFSDEDNDDFDRSTIIKLELQTTWLMPSPVRIRPQLWTLRLRILRNIGQRNWNSVFPFWKRDEDLVLPNLKAKR